MSLLTSAATRSLFAHTALLYNLGLRLHGKPMTEQASARIVRWPALVGLASIMLGLVLSRCVEPGVQVTTIPLAGDIPALKFAPQSAGAHPVAILAHGVTASKETLFRFGEALAHAGFVAYAFDFPGQGAARHRFSPRAILHTPERVAQALGHVDIFLGHSMGAYVGGLAVANGQLSPQLFISVGALPRWTSSDVPLLLLAGRFEEAVSVTALKAQTQGRLVLSPWCDHALEPYDPSLVQAAVDAACAAVGKTVPPPPTRWLWRWAGMILGILGGLTVALWLPRFPQRFAWARGPVVAAIMLSVMALTTHTWFGGLPILRRLPQQVVIAVLACLILYAARSLKIPRWMFAALPFVAMLGCALLGISLLALFMGCGAIVLTWSAVIGTIAAIRGSPRDGDIAMAIFVGYTLGQWMPMLY
jgi:hypothetical protein